MPETTDTGTERRIVTLHDIAARCGMNIATVSRALRGDRSQVSASTIDRINAVAREMGYNPNRNQAARRLVMRKFNQQPLNHAVALKLPPSFNTTESYFASLLNGVLDVMVSAGFGVFVVAAEDEQAETLHPIIERCDIDGLLFPGEVPPQIADFQPIYTETTGRALPIVSMIHSDDGYPSVVADDVAGAYALCRHLLELGHRHLLHSYSVPSANAVAGQRYAGICQAYLDQGLEPGQYLHYMPFHTYGKDPAVHDWVWEYLRDAVQTYPQVTGMFARNDYEAVQIYEALQLNGIRVPDDLSLVGFDDTHVIADDEGRNILTTVGVPLREIGMEAAQLILRLIDGAAPPTTRIVMPVTPVFRRSVRQQPA
ncbi:MAG: LacI family DNA-binding transcriptional regulator [Armatimonadota bacterium]